jgi:hypothetical protein
MVGTASCTRASDSASWLATWAPPVSPWPAPRLQSAVPDAWRVRTGRSHDTARMKGTSRGNAGSGRATAWRSPGARGPATSRLRAPLRHRSRWARRVHAPPIRNSGIMNDGPPINADTRPTPIRFVTRLTFRTRPSAQATWCGAATALIMTPSGHSPCRSGLLAATGHPSRRGRRSHTRVDGLMIKAAGTKRDR